MFFERTYGRCVSVIRLSKSLSCQQCIQFSKHKSKTALPAFVWIKLSITKLDLVKKAGTSYHDYGARSVSS